MIYIVQVDSCGMVVLPSFMKTGAGPQKILRSSPEI